jgi:pentafunctional AROM polypeptide
MIGTVPASATAVLDDVEASSSGDIISLTNNMFDHRDGPAMVVDMAYRPAETLLLGLARKIAEEHWSAVTGLEVLLEQGYEQFKIWMGSCEACLGKVFRRYLKLERSCHMMHRFQL